MLNEKIKENIKQVIQSHNFIIKASDVVADIIQTEEYKNNIEFISEYHKQIGDDIDKSQIEKMYNKLLNELITLLEKKGVYGVSM